MMNKIHVLQSCGQLSMFQIHLDIEKNDRKTPFESLELSIRYCFLLN